MRQYYSRQVTLHYDPFDVIPRSGAEPVYCVYYLRGGMRRVRSTDTPDEKKLVVRVGLTQDQAVAFLMGCCAKPALGIHEANVPYLFIVDPQ